MKWEAGLPLDGNGYAIVQGYQVGQDAFRTLKPESFNVADFLAQQEVWQAAQFQVDDTGEGVPFVIFDEPVIRSADLFEQTADTNDFPVLRARFTLTVPPVRACLVFAGERFQYVAGEGPRDQAETVANLNGEFVTTAHGETALEELPYADGKGVARKAAEIAEVLLRRPFQYAEGGYRVQGSNGTQLSSLIDRVSVHVTPQGVWEEVDFTKERQRDAFEPERNLDRIKLNRRCCLGRRSCVGQGAGEVERRGVGQSPGAGQGQRPGGPSTHDLGVLGGGWNRHSRSGVGGHCRGGGEVDSGAAGGGGRSGSAGELGTSV
jgi:uncharacterized membrane protein YgcG